MKMIAANSSQVAEHGYDPATKILAVRYNTGVTFNSQSRDKP